MTLRTMPDRSSFRLSLSTLVIALGLCTGLVACGSGGGGNAGPVGSQPPLASPQYAYVASTVDNKIYMYSIDSSTGQLTATGTTDTGNSPTQIAFDPAHQFAYVVNSLSHNVSMYMLNKTTGELTLNGTIATGGLNPSSVTVDPTGRFVYVANQNSGATVGVSAFSINSNGTLTFIGSVPAPHEPFSVSVDPKGHFVYVASGDPPPSPQTVPPTPTHNQVHLFEIKSDGSLSPVGSPIPAPEVAVDVVTHSSLSSLFVYAASGISSMVTAYKADTNTGVLTLIGSLPTGGTAARAVTIDHTGNFAYVANIGSNDVSTFRINPTTGALTPIGSPIPMPVPVGGTRSGNEGARWVVAHPSEPFLYITYLTDPPPHIDPNHVPAHVAAFRINPDGSLAHISDTPTGDGSVGITVISTP